jgi:hypothetical protein
MNYDSDTGSESEKERESVLEKMTKEELWFCLKKSNCRMLAGRNTNYMTKEQMVDYLIKCKCPVVLRMLTPLKIIGKK